jgi:hypothetical protein
MAPGNGWRKSERGHYGHYHVDYLGMKKSFYSAEADVVVVPINYEGIWQRVFLQFIGR